MPVPMRAAAVAATASNPLREEKRMTTFLGGGDRTTRTRSRQRPAQRAFSADGGAARLPADARGSTAGAGGDRRSARTAAVDQEAEGGGRVRRDLAVVGGVRNGDRTGRGRRCAAPEVAHRLSGGEVHPHRPSRDAVRT